MKTFSAFKCLAVSLMAGISGIALADIPSGYYDSLEGLSGVALKKAVKSAAGKHTVISYGNDTWSVFFETDTHVVGSQRCWWDMYSNDNVAAPNSGSHPGMNIEHSVANSWWGGTKNDAYKDIHHLNPSNSEANNRKGNYPLGEVANLTWNNGVTFVGKPASGTCGGASYVYEPADEYKGDFARVFFYMFTIYDNISWVSQWNWMYDTSSDLTLKPWAYELLLKWAEEDPVSQKEVDRNNAVYRHQKNRNPFIDFPELASHIWGSKKNVPFHADGLEYPDQPERPDTPDKPDQPDQPENPTVPSGYWYAVTKAADLNEDDRYVLVSVNNHAVMSTTLGSSGKYFQVCGELPSFDTSDITRIAGVPDDAAVLTLTKRGAGWTVAVSSVSGQSEGYLVSTGNKELGLTASASANGTTVNIKPGASGTQFEYNYSGSNQASYIYYNNSAPRFTTYNSNGQEPVMLYRLEEEKHQEAGVGTGLPENADEVVYGIYDINGRRMNASSVSELDRGIYIVVSNFGTRKVMLNR